MSGTPTDADRLRHLEKFHAQCHVQRDEWRGRAINAENEVSILKALLAQREAEVAALQDVAVRYADAVLAEAISIRGDWSEFDGRSLLRFVKLEEAPLRALLADTREAAALAYATTLKAAGARDMQERAAQCAFEFWCTISHELSDGDTEIQRVAREAAGACAKAIRELPPVAAIRAHRADPEEGK
jgi:hypothetical protein